VIAMAGHAVGSEREDRFGLDVVQDRRDLRDGFILVDLGARAVGIPEPMVIPHAEQGQTRVELGGADSNSFVEAPRVVVREARLATRHRVRCRATS
jgi:hypothetical protein